MARPCWRGKGSWPPGDSMGRLPVAFSAGEQAVRGAHALVRQGSTGLA